MPKYNSDQVQNGLHLLCQMLPGTCQAVVIQDSDPTSNPLAVWPVAHKAQDEVITAARLASSQKKRVTTTLSSGQDKNSMVDTIIAMPLLQPEKLNATLAVQVRIEPSQQSVVTQIRHAHPCARSVRADSQRRNRGAQQTKNSLN